MIKQMTVQEQSKLLLDYISLNLENVSKTFAAFYKAKYQLTPNQMSTIWYLRRFKSMNMSEFAEKMNMSKQQATQLIELMVKKGYVQRQYHPENRRGIWIENTNLAMEAIASCESDFVDNAFSQMEQLTSQEVNDLLESMQTLLKILPKINLGPIHLTK